MSVFSVVLVQKTYKLLLYISVSTAEADGNAITIFKYLVINERSTNEHITAHPQGDMNECLNDVVETFPSEL